MAAEDRSPTPRKRTRPSSPMITEVEVEGGEEQAPRRWASGFTSVREFLSYLLGTGILLYGVLEAAPDRQLVVVGAGLSLLGLPIVGGIFEKKGA